MKKLPLLFFLLIAALLAGCAGFGGGRSAGNGAAEITIQIGKDKTRQRVVIALYETEAPATVENFKELARKGFYKGHAFHRVFPRTLVQAGDPLSAKKDRTKVGTGGPGYTLPPEIRRPHVAGAVAMSRLPDPINPGRRSSGSQFYIALKPMPELDGKYTVFGRVVSGMEVLDRVSQVPADSNDNPLDRVKIKSIKIVPMPAAPNAQRPTPNVQRPG